MPRTSMLLAAVLLLAPRLSPAQPAAPSPAPGPRALADEMDAYLVRHVLSTRYPASVDTARGGFHANFATDWTKLEDRRRFVVYQARQTWTAATVALSRPALRDEYLRYARHGIAQLRDRQWDRAHGGFWTSVLLDGAPDPRESATKMTYGQAFAVYALAVAHRATGDADALALARQGYEWVEAHCREKGRPGYVGAVKADGSALPWDEDAVLPKPDSAMGVPAQYRDMNTSIHLLEAWTELLKEWPDPGLRASTRSLLELVRDRFYSEPGTLHLFLDETGWPIAGPSSFGHDVETGFLLLEAAETLGVKDDPKLARVARRLVDHALALGYDAKTGQLWEQGFAIRPAFDKSIEWWAQFEMVNALSVMDAEHGRETPRYREELVKAWRFLADRLTDHDKGGTFGGIDADGRLRPAKSHDWFATYHQARALILTADRLRRSGDVSR
ncbi:MAG: AGE family epimerase/isomerase [Vicinamibacteria bacterium]